MLRNFELKKKKKLLRHFAKLVCVLVCILLSMCLYYWNIVVEREQELALFGSPPRCS